MRTVILTGAAFVALASATPAFAQEEEYPFDGFYIGGSIGYSVQPNDGARSAIRFDRDLNGSFGDTVITSTGQNAFGVNTTGGANSGGFCGGNASGNALSFGCTKDRDGLEYFGRIGADTHLGPVVIGVVGEAGRSEIVDYVTAFSTTPAAYTMRREIDYQGSIRGRIGITPGPMRTTLFYATGGASYARIKNGFTTTNTANSFTPNGKTDAWGFTAGGGVEQKLGKNFSIGLEYLYNDLKDNKARVRVGPGTAPATNPFLLAGAGGTDFRRNDPFFRWHSIRATAAFRF
jgi:outer membrane immunogenic protein